MIHNLIVDINQQSIFFKFINQIGICKVQVLMKDLTKDNQMKVIVTDYQVLGQEYNQLNPAHNEGINRISQELADVCQCNNWQLWGY